MYPCISYIPMNRIYIHGLPKGQKIDNLTQDPRISFCVERMEGILLDERPSDVNTAYQSVVTCGHLSARSHRSRN